MVDWIEIKTEYETTDISQRKLADKYDISYPTIRDRSKREGWLKSKEITRSKIVAETSQKAIEKVVDRNTRILNLADRLADKVEEAIEQLEKYIVTNKKKTKTVEYDEKGFKPTKEVVIEEEIKNIMDGIIDKQGLKTLTAALKDIKDITTEKQVIDVNTNLNMSFEQQLKELIKDE